MKRIRSRIEALEAETPGFLEVYVKRNVDTLSGELRTLWETNGGSIDRFVGVIFEDDVIPCYDNPPFVKDEAEIERICSLPKGVDNWTGGRHDKTQCTPLILEDFEKLALVQETISKIPLDDKGKPYSYALYNIDTTVFYKLNKEILHKTRAESRFWLDVRALKYGW